jgi:uncharacterized membrane protein YfcA
MLPVSITMFVFAALGSRLSTRYPVRTIVRAGLIIIVVAVVGLLWTASPTPHSPCRWRSLASEWV